MKKMTMLGLAFSCLAAYQGWAGTELHGGDPSELMFQDITANISQWIESGNADTLMMPSGISLKTYKENMLRVASRYQISFTDATVLVQGAEKVCRNSGPSSQPGEILCNRADFAALESNAHQLFQLVHHELAGLAGIEVGEGAASDYYISRQISAYLESEFVERLPVRKTAPLVDLKESAKKRFLQVTYNFLSYFMDPVYTLSGDFQLSIGARSCNGRGFEPVTPSFSLPRMFTAHIGSDPTFVAKSDYGYALRFSKATDGRLCVQFQTDDEEIMYQEICAGQNGEAEFNTSQIQYACADGFHTADFKLSGHLKIEDLKKSYSPAELAQLALDPSSVNFGSFGYRYPWSRFVSLRLYAPGVVVDGKNKATIYENDGHTYFEVHVLAEASGICASAPNDPHRKYCLAAGYDAKAEVSRDGSVNIISFMAGPTEPVPNRCADWSTGCLYP